MAGGALPHSVDLIARLEAEQRKLILTRFDHDDAWRLGLLLVGLARARGAAVTIDIRHGRQQLFHYALPGTSADNDAWIRRKSRIVTRFGASSYLVGLRHRLAGRTSADETGLNPRRYAAYGGSFPLTIAGVGVVGTVTVSGLPQADDHRLVVEALQDFVADQHDGSRSLPKEATSGRAGDEGSQPRERGEQFGSSRVR
ncbi:heme-degrading domain-containing protein [Micromonospora purpureochromogenes]|uniref:heme-degrading domain-containing protein n=1 Tax=Micromonospora purpureochromogenes TaxID=47872 RepID=UPI0033EC840B